MAESQPARRRRKRPVLLAGAAILAGAIVLGLTTTPPPSPALADEIDHLLGQESCIVSADRWPARYYVWAGPSWRGRLYPLSALVDPWLGSDTSTVRVALYQGASPRDYPPGRHRLRADQDHSGIDDSNFMFAAGTYDVRTRKLTVWGCGSNAR